MVCSLECKTYNYNFEVGVYCLNPYQLQPEPLPFDKKRLELVRVGKSWRE